MIVCYVLRLVGVTMFLLCLDDLVALILTF